MSVDMVQRIRGCAIGAAVGDALGMPLEFRPRQSMGRLVRTMRAGRLDAGSFTDDTEMALALAESLIARAALDLEDLAQRFVVWYRANPPDIGNHTRAVLRRVAAGMPWDGAVDEVQRSSPESAGNGSVMRCWPISIAYMDSEEDLRVASELQGRVTHPHTECVAGCVFINLALYHLLKGRRPADAVECALKSVTVSGLRRAIGGAPGQHREALVNSGWVRHTVESAVWGLLTTRSFEDAVVQVVNLGNDADTAGAVIGALAGAAYGLDAIPQEWRDGVHGEWPLRSGRVWREADIVALAEQLAGPRAAQGET